MLMDSVTQPLPQYRQLNQAQDTVQVLGPTVLQYAYFWHSHSVCLIWDQTFMLSYASLFS